MDCRFMQGKRIVPQDPKSTTEVLAFLWTEGVDLY